MDRWVREATSASQKVALVASPPMYASEAGGLVPKVTFSQAQGERDASTTENMKRWRIGLVTAAAAVCVSVTVFVRLGHPPLYTPDEGRNAEIAREMKENGAWLVPRYDGLAYLDKPSVFFKLVAISLALVGDNEWA